jgi:LytS/YehU family sensor histidine kinase
MRPQRYDTMWFWLFIWGLLVYGVWRVVRARIAFRKLDTAVSELQLQALQSQMSPHFIGNSINAIQQFFYPPDPVRASEFIALFTRLLRQTLTFSDQTFITFAEEHTYIRDYLEMMKLRFGDFFQYEISGAENIPPGTPFPCMLLQPILENATLHGLAPEGISVLKVDFSMPDNRLLCTVSDNGAGLLTTSEQKESTGSTRQSKGLEILRKKVETLNRRYKIGLFLDLQDLSGTIPPLRGTRAIIRFFPGRIPETALAPKRRPPFQAHIPRDSKPVNPS